MKKRILVVADQGCKDTLALEKANQIAKLFDSTVVVVAFIDCVEGKEDALSHVELLKQQVKDNFDASIDVSAQVAVTSDIAIWIKQHVTEFDFGIVVKTGNRSETLFYTPTDWQLIRELDCNLLITSTKKWRASSTILASVDVCDNDAMQATMNNQVLTEANLWAKNQGHELHVAYSVPVPTAQLELDIVEMDEVERKRLPKAKDSLSALLESNELSQVCTHIEFGAADKRIPSIANKIKADLVVMGSVGRKGVQGFLLGNTAEKVLRNLRTDILIIKPKRKG